MFRILVTGDRSWTDDNYPVIFGALDTARNRARTNNILVIHGGANGVDKLAGQAAFRLGFGVRSYPANWSKYKKGAGPIRNNQMIKENKIDQVLAFHDDLGQNKGTRDMVNKALEMGLPVRHYKSTGYYIDMEQQKLNLEDV